jgi:hypothetical protein
MAETSTGLENITVGQLRSGQLPKFGPPHDVIAMMHPAKQRALAANPFARDEDVASIIGMVNGIPVGRMDAFPSVLHVDGVQHRVVYGSSLFVTEDARESGTGLMILLRFQALNPTVAVCGISQMIKPIYQKLGWTHFPMRRMVQIRRSRAFVQAILKSYPLARVAGWPVDRALSAHRRVMRLFSSKGSWLEVVAESAATVAGVLRSAPATARVCPDRSIDWYAWELGQQFSDEPSRRTGLYSIRDRSGAVVAVFMTKARRFETVTQRQLKNVVLASLQDWIIYEPEAIDEADLCLIAADQLGSAGPDAIEICVPNPETAARLKRMGFIGIGELDFLYKANAKSPVFKAEFKQASAWRLRPADGDNFFS